MRSVGIGKLLMCQRPHVTTKKSWMQLSTQCVTSPFSVGRTLASMSAGWAVGNAGRRHCRTMSFELCRTMKFWLNSFQSYCLLRYEICLDSYGATECNVWAHSVHINCALLSDLWELKHFFLINVMGNGKRRKLIDFSSTDGEASKDHKDIRMNEWVVEDDHRARTMLCHRGLTEYCAV